MVIACRAGEAWAQEALFRRYVRLVVGLAHRLVPGDADTDEVVQDAFVYALNRLETLDNPQAFASWISSIVVRTASKHLRKRRLLKRLGLRDATPVDPGQIVASNAPPDVAAELRALYGVIARLPAEQRVALVLRRVEGMEIAEVAAHMGLSAATVKRRLAAAESRLERRRSGT